MNISNITIKNYTPGKSLRTEVPYIESNIDKLPEDVTTLITGFLHLNALNNLCFTSKKWEVITNDAPFWRKLAEEAKCFNLILGARKSLAISLMLHEDSALSTVGKLFSENINVKPFYDKAIANFNIISSKTIDFPLKREINMHINFLEIMKKLETVTGDGYYCNEQDRDLAITFGDIHDSQEILPKELRYIAGICCRIIYFKREDYFTQRVTASGMYELIKNSVEIENPWAKRYIANCKFILVESKFFNHHNAITDQKAAEFLYSNFECPQYGEASRVYLATLEVERRSNLLSDENLLNLLNEKIYSTKNQVKIDFLIAQMIISGRAKNYPIHHIIEKIDALSKLTSASSVEKTEANLYLIQFCLHNIENSKLKDYEAINLAWSMLNEKFATDKTLSLLKCFCAEMYFQNRVTFYDGHKFLLDIVTDPKIEMNPTKTTAYFILAKDHMNNRTEYISDQIAYNYFLNNSKNSRLMNDENVSVKQQSCFYRAILISQYRCDQSDTPERIEWASKIFLAMISDSSLNSALKNEAEYYLTLMLAERDISLPNMSDTKIYETLIKLSNIYISDQEKVDYIHFYIIEMNINYRIEIMPNSIHEPVNYLKSILLRKNLSVRLQKRINTMLYNLADK